MKDVVEHNRDMAHFLLEVYEEQLWRHLGYKSFLDFVRDRWQTRTVGAVFDLVRTAFAERLAKEMLDEEEGR